MKKKPEINGGFLIALGLNLVFSLEWTVPAWILLALHFFLDISILWFAGAMGLWFLIVLGYTAFFSLLCRAGNTPTPQRPNKNPYSVKENPYEKREMTAIRICNQRQMLNSKRCSEVLPLNTINN